MARVAKPFLEAAAPVARQVCGFMCGAGGSALVSEWSVGEAGVIVESRAALLGRRRIAAISLESLREQFGRLGNTAYELGRGYA